MTSRYRVHIATSTALAGALAVLVTPFGGTARADTPAVTLAPIAVEGEAERPVETATVIDQGKIDREAPKSLRELFKDEPSITLPGSNTAAQKIYLHGIDQAKLNVSIDGAAQRAGVWHHNGNLTLDPTFLKAVEVSPGVAAADSGPGALGGVVAFQTKSARDMLRPGQTVGGTAMMSFDTNSKTFNTTGSAYAATEGFEILGIASWGKGGSYTNGRGDKESGTGTDFVSGLGKASFETGGGHRFEISAERAVDDAERRLRPNMGVIANAQGRLMNENTSARTTVRAAYETTEPTDWINPKIELTYNLSRLERPNSNGLSTAHGDFNSDVESLGAKVQNTFAIPTGTVVAGLDVNHDDLSLERFHFRNDVGERITNLGAFLQARVAPVERLRVSSGLRVDHQAYRSVDRQTFVGTGASPNVTVEYGLTEAITAFAGYSYVWGGLEMSELALYHAGNYRYADNLKPVTSHNYRGGVRYSAHGFRGEVAGFRTFMENPMAWNYTTRVRINGLDLETLGVDLSAGYDWSNASVGIKYTHTDVTYGDRIALGSDYGAAVTVGDLISINGHYTFQDQRLTIGGSSEIAAGIDDPALTAAGFRPIKGYYVFNVFSEWQPLESAPDWTVRVELNNLFDAAYIPRSSYGQTSVITPALAEGRALRLSTTIKF